MRRSTLVTTLLAAVLAAGNPATAGHVEVFALDGGAGASLQERAEARAVADAARTVAAPDRFEVRSVRFSGATPAPATRAELELVEADGPNRSGIVRLAYRVLAGGVPSGTARVTVRGAVVGPALVAASTLRFREPISARDVTLVEADLTRLLGEPVRSLADLERRVPARTLATGRVLTADLLADRPVIRQGDTVELRIEGDGFVVTATGRAMRDAAPGETVTARNLASGVEVTGRASEDGAIVVSDPRSAGRGPR